LLLVVVYPRNDWHLSQPEIVLHSTYVDAPKILKESFDIIWNAAGGQLQRIMIKMAPGHLNKIIGRIL
jgi:hypothetical protein